MCLKDEPAYVRTSAESCIWWPQVGETEPFISELLTGLTSIIQDLETHQIHMFYETVGLTIGAESLPEKRDEYLVRLSGPTNFQKNYWHLL